tara:strand:+ start:82 stop:906 length:825 start_codon:yes stop_codon:yes gene_type:complete
MFTTFYHNSVRNLVVSFGSLFNDIHVERKLANGTTKERIKVPIAYGPKEKFIRRISDKSSISDNIKTEISLPRLGFEITGMDYDPARKRNTMNKYHVTSGVTAGQKLTYDYSEVPYNFTFQLSAMVRHMDDGLQITEQILPYFTPEFNVSLNMSSLHTKIDIPVILQSSTVNEDYEGDFDSRRNISFDFTFVAKSYVYGPLKTSKIIRETDVTFWNAASFDSSGGPSGSTAAMSRILTSITGPSGASSGIDNYSTKDTTFVQGASLGYAGNTYA